MKSAGRGGWPKSDWGQSLFGCLIGLPLVAFFFLRKPYRSPALRRFAAQIAEEVEGKSYEYWIQQELPIHSERTFEGKELFVEIDALEIRPDYVHIGISVSDGGISAYYPVGTSAIVRKEEKPSIP